MGSRNRKTGFGKIKLCLDKNEINAPGSQSTNLPPENFKQLFWRQADKMSGRPHISCDKKFPTHPDRHFAGKEFCVFRHAPVEKFGVDIRWKLAGIAAEGRSKENIRSRFGIGRVHGTHDIGARQTKLCRVHAGRHTERLKHRTCSPINEQRASKV